MCAGFESGWKASAKNCFKRGDDDKVKLTRVAASMRRDLIPRSLTSPSWRRSTKFSTSSDRLGRIERTAKLTASASNRRRIRAKAITRHHATNERELVNPQPLIQLLRTTRIVS